VTLAGSCTTRGHVDDVGTAARFAGIRGLETDGTSLFISDSMYFNTRKDAIAPSVRQLRLSDGAVTTMLGRPGQASFKPGQAGAARVNEPWTLYFDASSHTMYLYDHSEFVFAKIK